MAEPIIATGRRKTSIARVRIFPNAEGGVLTINDRPFENYFPTETTRMIVTRPLHLTETIKNVAVHALVDGGGIEGQAGALSHSISRALIKMDPKLRTVLKREGLLMRDPRMKERKKPGQPGARKRFQFSKR